MSQFKNRVFGAAVDPDIIEEFKRLQGGQHPLALEPAAGSKFHHYLGDKNPFARMWCAVNINDSIKTPRSNGDTQNLYQQVKRVEGGKYVYYARDDINEEKPIEVGDDKDSKNLIFSVNENNENSYGISPLEPMVKGYQRISQLSNEFGGGNQFLKPAAGITSVTSKTQGALGALQSTTIEFTVHNRHDFENIFLPYFLRPGARVVVDYGWSDKDIVLYDQLKQLDGNNLDWTGPGGLEDFLYNDNTGFIRRFHGRMNTVMGNVIKYDSSTTEQGSFNCSLEIISSNTGLIDKEVSDDNNIKFMFANSIDDLLVNALAASAGLDVKTSLSQIKKNQRSNDPIDTAKATKEFFNALNLSTEKGLITTQASKLGLFYQDLSARAEPGGSADKLEDKEKMYISYGKFEDMFLNGMLAGTHTKKYNKNGQAVNLFIMEATKDHSNIFDSRTSYLRWSEDLFNIQNAPIAPNESLPSFILPSEWDNSYNSLVLGSQGIEGSGKEAEYGPFRVTSEQDKAGNNPIYSNTPVIPLRDVFISVPLISKAFKTKSSVNDALTFIFDQLTSDSNLVWNIKMKTSTVAKGGIAFHDVNLMPEIEEMLLFDVTSGETIVKACDLKFTTPKAGLSSMIAISNLDSPRTFSQQELGALNNLNLLKAGREDVRIRSLPLQGDFNDNLTKPIMDINFNKLTPQNTVVLEDDMVTDIRSRYQKYKTSVTTLQTLKDDEPDAPPPSITDEVSTEYPNTEWASSIRSALQKKVRNEFYNKRGSNTISPILPIELDITIFGNSYLEIGDYFNVNYLPTHYKDRVFFQVIGIEDSISGNSWQTSYTTVMRVNPSKKSEYSTPSKEIVIPEKLFETNQSGDPKTNELKTKLSLGIEVNSIEIYEPGYGTDIKVDFSNERIKSTNELKEEDKKQIKNKQLNRVRYRISKLGGGKGSKYQSGSTTQLLSKSSNLAWAYGTQAVLLSDEFLKPLLNEGKVYGEIEHSNGTWKDGKTSKYSVVVSYGDLNMQDIIELYDEEPVSDDYGLDKSELALANALTKFFSKKEGDYSLIMDSIVPGGSFTQEGIYWTDNLAFVDYSIIRIPTAIRFKTLNTKSTDDLDNPERVAHMKIDSTQIGVFNKMEIPMWVINAQGNKFNSKKKIIDRITIAHNEYKTIIDAMGSKTLK